MQTELLEGYRLSPQQKRLCLLRQDDESIAYRAACVVLIEGNLNTELLAAAVGDVVARHEILRTTLRQLPGLSVPVQVINEAGAPQLAQTDLSALSPPEQAAELDRMFEQSQRAAGDAESDVPLHISLARLSDSRSALVLSLPATCSDRAGLKNLVREIGRCYEARRAGEELDDEPVQYADVSEYLADLLESEDTEAGRKYWRNFAALDHADLRLPFERPAPGDAVFAPGQSIARTASAELTARIEAAARESEVSTSSLLLACWQLILWRISGQSEVSIGTAFDGREVEGLGNVPGLFERYLPVAAHLENGMRFDELLRQVEASTSAAAQWQDYFQWERPAANATDGGGGVNFFPVCFEFDERPDVFPAGDIKLSIIRQHSRTDRFNLKLSCRLRDDHLAIELPYDARLFDAADIQHLAEQFHTLLQDVARDAAAPVERLRLLDDETRERLLFDFNRTRVARRREVLVHRRIEEQAARVPQCPAVAFGEPGLSYAELNGRANQLARYLRRLGVAPDVPVVVCMERSVELLVGILGVLKAGGAYVPLDPTYPRQRIAFILEETQAPVILTQSHLQDNLPPHHARVIRLDAEWSAVAGEAADDPAVKLAGDNLAYVIYTSGSTGQPKGVMIPHSGLTNYLDWACEAYRAAEGKGSPVHSSVGFDLTVTSLFTPLMVGEKVTLLANEEGPEALAELLRRGGGFSLVKITPPHLSILGELMKEGEVAGVANALVIGGEALFAESVSLWRAHAPQTRIINEYGPTETVVGCCVYEVKPEDAARGAVSIGRPIANTEIYILDETMQPVALNVPGEIYIGGAGLARGYLKRPDLTAERFVPHPFGAEPGARLYRTGDAGRHRADGNVEYLGRLDQQVKLRGYRVELGEIEAALADHAGVREAVVVVREDGGEKRLVAYLVGERGGAELDAARVREHLKERLPEYMIPAAFVTLERLPLTSNGKIDRRALPAPDTHNSGLERTYAAPRTETEALLAGLWAKALGLERVGIHDDFFELGGDSILSIQISNRANSQGLHLRPGQVFRHRTIAALAAEVRPVKAAEAEQGIVEGAVPLTPIQHWFFEQQLAEPHYWNQAAMFEAREALDPSILEQAFAELVRHHDALRLHFVREETGWKQFVAGEISGAGALLRRLDLTSLAEDEQGAALSKFAAELQASLNLSEGEVVRAALIERGGGRPNLLLVVIHHLAVDIVSWGILVEGLQEAYRQLVRGQKVQLASKTTSFKEWAERLVQYAQTPKLRREADFWLEETSRAAAAMPVDFPGGINTEASARSVWMSLGAEETRALLQEVPRVYHTMINDVLLTALAQAFTRWTRSPALIIDLENHGREEIFDDVDLSRTVGWFTCIFPLRLDPGGARGEPGAALKAVKEQVRRVPEGGIGYGLLRYLSEDREIAARLAAAPRAEISFNYVGRTNRSEAESALFKASAEPAGASHSPRGQRAYLIEINGGVDGDGRLRMAFTYSENLHRASTVANFGENFIRSLADIIEHCVSTEAGGHTPSDFQLGHMNQRELDDLMAELGELED
ncbi:MAG TPA: amino acid adenylation domain-containing protein [Pyrinomonadaceae bacterium]|jgi:amino acid adenylation domain-containing protein/non-ribosomal peptide synthase protein (TIGR01720 family)